MKSAAQDRCECGAPADDISFDRSICACGSMHYFCAQCGTQAEPCADEEPTAAQRHGYRASYEVEPFHEPEGRRTWCVKEIVVGPHGYFLRHIISFHETFTEADRQRERMKLREREGSWGEPYEEAILDG